MTTKRLIRGYPNPVTVVVGETGVRVESGRNAIDCTVYLNYEQATRLAEFIIVDLSLLEVEIPNRKRGRHEVRELR